jgi:glycosyltransferase involved in cell wall biosynthesis
MNSLFSSTNTGKSVSSALFRSTARPAIVADKVDSANAREDTITKLSVIVIARNEERAISDCLKSVAAAFGGVPHELILVDSASTDRTVEIGREFGARVLVLPATAPLRPAVGRHVGYLASRGELLLFLDGDSVLNEDWLMHGVAALQAEPRLAGVAGEMEEVIDGETMRPVLRSYPATDYVAANHLNGSALYRRAALESAGGFNPFLCAAEEAELGARLRKAGYLLRRLPVHMTRHHAKHAKETIPELLRRINRGFYYGLGQFVRYAYTQRLPVKQPFDMVRRHVQFAALLLLGLVAAAASAFEKSVVPFAAWLLAIGTIFGLFALRGGGLRKPAYYFLEWLLTSPFVILGLARRPRSNYEFPELDAVDMRDN